MASKVNTKFVIILVGSVVALAVGVGALAAYSLRMSGERNIKAGDARIAEAQQLRSSGNEAEAIESINDAASQYGRAVNKDPSRRDWLITWRDTLLQTIPETDVEYSKQYRERYIGALDRLATIDSTAPGPQLEQVLVQERLFRVSGGPNAMSAIAELVSRRVAALPPDSPTAIRLNAIGGLANTDRAALESVDSDVLDEARGAMREFYDAYVEDPERFLEPVPADLDEEGRRRFVEEARNDHARIGLGLVRWHVNQRTAAQAEGRSREAAASLSRAEELLAEMLADGLGYENDARFLILAAQIDLAQAQDSIGNPAERRNAQLRIIAESADGIMSALAESDPSDLPVGEMTGLTSWYSDDALRESLAAEFERAVSASPEDPRLLAQAAAAMRSLDELERSLELYAAIRELPRPTLSLDGLVLPQVKVNAAFAQVEVNLALREQALRDGDDREAGAYLDAARAARDVLASESGVTTRPFVLRANAEVAIAEGKTTQAIRLLEEFRSEFGDTSAVLGQLARQLLRQGTTGEAKQILERLVNTDSITTQGVLMLADIYGREGDNERALELLERRARLSSSPEEFSDAIEQVRRLIAIEGGESSDDPVLDAVVRANDAIARRDLGVATAILDELERAEDGSASNLQVIVLRAQIAAFEGDRERALEILERARQIDPENEAIAGMIRRLSSDDLVQAQVDDIESSDRSEIDKALSKYDLYRAVGQSEEALAAMSEAERVDPDHQRVIDFRFAEALGRGDLDAAGRIAARAADANVDGVDGLLYQGRLQLARGESAAAVRTLRSAIELVPSSVAIRRYLGQALLVTGQVDEGIESLRRAYEARRDNLDVLAEYVQVLDQLGRVEEARAVLDPGNDPSAAARVSRSVTNVWLSLEAEAGNVERALAERRTYFNADVRSGAIADSELCQQNALQLIELLVERGSLDEAEQVLAEIRSSLSELEVAQARAGIALGRAGELEDPAAVRQAEQEAIADFRAAAENEAQAANNPSPLVEVARFAFASGRFELGLEILQSAVPFESTESRLVSRELARRLGQRASRLDDEAQTLEAQARQREGADPLGAEAVRERAAQARDRATASREKAVTVYSDLLASGVDDASSRIVLSLAELRMQLGQLDAASELIQRVRTAEPDDLDALLLAANLAERRGNRADAGRLYNEAVEKHSSNFLSFYRRALFNSADMSRAADVLFDLQRVNQLRPSLTEGWLLRYRVNMQANDPDAAFAALRQGIERAPSIADTLSRQLVQELVRFGRVVDAFSVAANRATENPMDAYWQFTAGTLARQRGAYSEAANFYDRLNSIPSIANDPTQVAQTAGLVLDARLRAGERVPEAQLRRLVGMIEELPAEGTSGVAQTMLLARAYAALPNERSRASALTQQAFSLAAAGSDEASPTAMLRTWYQDLPLVAGGAQQALNYVAELDQAIRNQKSQNPEAEIVHPLFIQVVALQAAQIRGEPLSDLIARAEGLLQQAQADPLAQFEIRKRLSNLKFAVGDVEGAAEEGRQALAINPNDLELLNNVAFYLAKYLDRVDEAVPFAERAAELAPENADVLDTVGVVYLLRGEYSEARNFFERSLRFARTQEQRLPANVHMADATLRSGSPESARTYLEAAERLLPVVDQSVRDSYTAEIEELKTRLNNG